MCLVRSAPAGRRLFWAWAVLLCATLLTASSSCRRPPADDPPPVPPPVGTPEPPGRLEAEEEEPEPEAVEIIATVVLDPGHGVGMAGDRRSTGRSGVGTSGIASGVHEFEAVFLVAEQIRDWLAEHAPEIKVVLTKDSAEKNISNLERARHMGDYNAAMLISLHFDAFPISRGGKRRTHAIVLPERHTERIGGVVFKTHNHNQAEEIALAEKLVAAVVEAFKIPDGDDPADGGVISSGNRANKGVLFETTEDWASNIGPDGEMWEERLYHGIDDPPNPRGLAVLLEMDNFRNYSVDTWLNDELTNEPIPERYKPISHAIAQVIVDHVHGGSHR